jgi:hypothetical protein
MAPRRRRPVNTLEENSIETMDEDFQPLVEEITESPVEVVLAEDVIPVIPVINEEKRERTKLAPKPVRVHPRNVPKFSKSRKGV